MAGFERYSAREQERVDQHRVSFEGMGAWEMDDKRREAIERRPSTLRKLGRVALDSFIGKRVLPGLYEASQIRRDKEAMGVALREYEKEEREGYEEFERRAEAEREKKEETERERRIAQEERDRETMGKELVEGMEAYRSRKAEEFRGERVQEISEKAFNERLTKLSDIDMASELPGSGVEKRGMRFEGEELTVYDMRGFPFSFLQHKIDYKGQGESFNAHRIGADMAKRLQDDPSIWAEPYEGEEKYGGLGGGAKSNAISMTYVNTEENYRMMDDKGLFYGFDHVRPSSIVAISERDGATSNVVDGRRTTLSERSPYMPSLLEKKGSTALYNEVQVRRYDDEGKPQLPDFVVIKDGEASDVILRHAAYFEIPVVNIETKSYFEKEVRKLEERLNGLNENSSYEEIRSVVEILDSSFLKDGTGSVIDGRVGLWGVNEIKWQIPFFKVGDLTLKAMKLRELEYMKKAEFIRGKLEKTTKRVEEATQEGEMFVASREGVGEVERKDYGERNWAGPTMHAVEVSVQTAPGGSYFETIAYDGNNPSPEADNVFKGANSEVYDELAPAVDAYISALRKNRKMLGWNVGDGS